MTVAAEWESFYVIVGSSAAALTGLQFVVIALSADTGTEGLSTGSAVFATPTVVHFCAVLLIASILCVPRQTPFSLAACLAGRLSEDWFAACSWRACSLRLGNVAVRRTCA